MRQTIVRDKMTVSCQAMMLEPNNVYGMENMMDVEVPHTCTAQPIPRCYSHIKIKTCPSRMLRKNPLFTIVPIPSSLFLPRALFGLWPCNLRYVVEENFMASIHQYGDGIQILVPSLHGQRYRSLESLSFYP